MDHELLLVLVFLCSTVALTEKEKSNQAAERRFDQYKATASIGYLKSSSEKRIRYYYQHGQKLTGGQHIDFPSSVCHSTLPENLLTNNGANESRSEQMVTVHFQCKEGEHCCGHDCCEKSIIEKIAALVFLAVLVISCVSLCFCLGGCQPRMRRRGIIWRNVSTVQAPMVVVQPQPYYTTVHPQMYAHPHPAQHEPPRVM